MKYMIAEGGTISELEECVNRYLEKGWEVDLAGFRIIRSATFRHYLQPMIWKSKEEIQFGGSNES
jgi:hypothetical protein